MTWTCYSCNAVNRDADATCIQCGGTVAAPKKFYFQWLLLGALFFMLTFLLGSYVGGILMSLSGSPVYQNIVLRILPAILFVVCGMLVGFASEGITILEAGLGAILGQGIAVAVFVYVVDASPIGWRDFFFGALPGALLAILGAWLGEKFQFRKERGGGITG